MGTNVIRECSRLQSAEETIPEAWHVPFKSLAAQHVGFVETTSKWCLKPWEVKDVFCSKVTVNQPSLKAQKLGTSQKDCKSKACNFGKPRKNIKGTCESM